MAERPLLKELGLSSYEQDAYLQILRRGKTNATDLVRSGSVPLGRIYGVLKELTTKGLIDVDRMEVPQIYSSNPPEAALRRLLGMKKEALDSKIRADEQALRTFLSNATQAENLSPKPKWDVYSGDAVVYEKMIPELIAECEKEMIIVGSNLGQTLTPDFLREFVSALDRGVAFYGLLPEDSERRFESFTEGFENAFGIEKFMTAIGKYSGKTLLMRTASLKGVTPFGIFDRAKVGFSITSPSGGRYLVTLVTDGRDVVDEFYALFRSIWDTHAEEFNLVNILGSLQETSRG